METTQEKAQKFRPTEWPSVEPGFGANHFPSLRSVRAHLTTVTAGLQLVELNTDRPPAWQTDLLRLGRRRPHSGEVRSAPRPPWPPVTSVAFCTGCFERGRDRQASPGPRMTCSATNHAQPSAHWQRADTVADVRWKRAGKELEREKWAGLRGVGG